jgi:hypothetical protein
VIFRCDGGSDHRSNLLDICVPCHALIHNGCDDESLPRIFAAHATQMVRHGWDFVRRTPHAAGLSVPDALPNAETDCLLRLFGLARLVFYRGVVAGEPWCARAWEGHLHDLNACEDGDPCPLPVLVAIDVLENGTRRALPAPFSIVVPLPQKERSHAA